MPAPAANLSLRQWALNELIAHHTGRERAITWAFLAARARQAGFDIYTDERNLRREVESLQTSGGPGALIVAAMEKPYGVFMATEYEEFDLYYRQQRRRFLTIAAKMRRQKTAAQLALRSQAQQLAMGL